jgi:hypothetical protein
MTKTINKEYDDYDLMYDLFVIKKLSNKEIADMLDASIKVIDLKIREHGLFVG